jgi:hypothetical protein
MGSKGRAWQVSLLGSHLILVCPYLDLGLHNVLTNLYFWITVKVRFQSPAVAGKYRSTFHAITTIMQEERFIGLYKGITSPLVSQAFFPCYSSPISHAKVSLL